MNLSLESIWDFLYLGGPAMAPLLLLSIIMWMLILERCHCYWRMAAGIGDRCIDEEIVAQGVSGLTTALESRLPLIGVLTKCAPLLGLLGTVLGMIRTFDIIAVYGTGNPRAMAAGISEALITTQTGLLIAIPGLCMHNFLSRRMENLKNRIIRTGMQIKRERQISF